MSDFLAALSAPTPAIVAAVHDGDSLSIDVPLPGVKELLGVDLWAHDLPIRVDGCNARELSQPGGIDARDNLRALLPTGTKVTVVLGRDKFAGRRGATVTLPDGQDLASLLCATGWAAPWNGHGAKPVPDWPRP